LIFDAFFIAAEDINIRFGGWNNSMEGWKTKAKAEAEAKEERTWCFLLGELRRALTQF